METVKDPEPADGGQSDLGKDISQAGDADRGEVPPTAGMTGADDLPVEAAHVWDDEGAGGYDATRTFVELMEFHVYGHRGPQALPPTPAAGPMPALLYLHRDLLRVRYGYPACLVAGDPDAAARSLSSIIDEVVAEIGGEGDEGARVEGHVHRLESTIRALADDSDGVALGELWQHASAELLESIVSPEEKERVQQSLSAARGVLHRDGDVIACGTRTPERLIEAVREFHWRGACDGWREELASLTQHLQDILQADFDRSPEGRDPDHLRASVGEGAGDDVDANVLSGILSASELGNPLPEKRRNRLQEILATILDVKPLFDEAPAKGTKLPFDLSPISNDSAVAVGTYHERTQIMVRFFRAIRIARLEIENHYREALHDPFFSRFDATHLAEDELALCPPVILVLDGDFFSAAGIRTLLDILTEGLPIKILAKVEDVCSDIEEPSVMPGWPTHLANMTMAMSHVYVMQSPVSQVSLLHDGFLEGLRYPGPALFSVYTGTPDHHPGLPVYLNSAAALESRVFPAFTFNPGRGDTLRERIDIGDNPQLDRDWPVEAFTYRTNEGDEITAELPMTAADLLLCDTRLGRHFWHVPAPKWHPDMVPLGEYLRLDPDVSGGKVPYLTTVEGKGRLGRAIITRAVLMSVLRCMSSWRHLQESGGVHNSFAENALFQEKQRLEEDKQREVDAIEEKYRVELDRDIEELTREIVQRIAAQLLVEGGDISKVTFAAPPPPPAVEAPAPAAPAESQEKKTEAEEEEEEESLSFDDPYIDTPLCTTCNDCTDLNGQMFAYNDNKQAYIKDPLAGSYRDLVVAAEKCPVNIIHPGKPKNADESDLDGLLKRAARYL